MDLGQFIIQNFHEFLTYTAFANATVGNLIMIAVGAFFIWLAIKKDFEPLLLVPILSQEKRLLLIPWLRWLLNSVQRLLLILLKKQTRNSLARVNARRLNKF